MGSTRLLNYKKGISYPSNCNLASCRNLRVCVNNQNQDQTAQRKIPDQFQADYKKEPQPVPVVHSSAYLKASATNVDEDAQTSYQVESTNQERDPTSITRFEGNALDWTLQKVDKALNVLEEQPLPLQREVFDASTSPAAKALGKGLKAAAEVTLQAGYEASKAAAPVGKWALKMGIRLASDLYIQLKNREDNQKDRGSQ
ncbi:hypothetical protein CEUSTIGMA_g1848.t1 [Chlamydomonas eustigma]|uniref:Senescence domain-containing protein n=1 Tax=Chlamydomonas eustigma TaxID=1157962 RepID=A0A250WV37_9CHLO|nr:hypothetical protein CEUSTIGMA_g1848.t1 [Chlamydomonas eustigma]|eukprot:GAX74400.1 hypothetical protein CEUSTIGMA_g1848.t1 [Chlamydomonas eustigma]